MMSVKASAISLAFVLSIPLGAAAQFGETPRVGFDHYESPVPVKANGQTILAYELHVTNFYAHDMTLLRLDIFDADHPKAPLATFEGEALLKCMMDVLAPDRRASRRNIGPLRRSVLVLLTAIGPETPVPSRLLHKLRFSTTSQYGKEVTLKVTYDGVAVAAEPVPVIASPLGPGRWWTINVANERVDGHRLGVAYFKGQLRLPQRYAVDFVKLDEDGRAAINDGKKNSDWIGYGAEVYAIADATVIYALDFIVENEPLRSRKSFTGNQVWLDLGDGIYALYEHLQTNSLRVKKGDRVREGQVIGLLGNSGNSDLPHLHLSLHDAPVAMQSSSVPFVIEELEYLGTRSGPGFTDAWQPDSTMPPVRYKKQGFRNDCVYHFVEGPD